MKRWIWLLLVASCAPDWPDDAALVAARVTGNSVELTWPEVGGADTFRVKRGDTVLSEALAGNATHFVAGGLDDGKSYTFSVAARGTSGPWSPELVLEVATPDVTAPKWKQPARFNVSVVTESHEDARLELSWTDAEDNVGVDSFRIHHRPLEPITVDSSAREHTLESIVPDGIWQIEARDSAGNRSDALAFNVATDLTAARHENLKERAMMFPKTGDSNPDLVGPDGIGVPLEAPTERGDRPVWLGPGGSEVGRAWVTARLGALETCYQKARNQDAALAGRLVVTLVSTAGEVNASRMQGINSAGLRTCVRSALSGKMPHKTDATLRTEIAIHMNPNPREEP